MSSPLTRRQVLHATAGTLAAAVLRGSSRAAETSPVTMPFGFSLYGMKSVPLPAALRTCAETGYEAVELATMPDWPADPRTLSADGRKSLRTLLTDLHLSLPAVMENLPLLAPEPERPKVLDRLKRAAELAHDLSPDVPPVLETVLGGKPDQWERVREQMAEQLLVWAEAARAARIVVAIKPHVGGALHTPDGALWLLEKVNRPEIRLAYDYSHYQLRGLTLAETIDTLGSKSVFCHVKDARGTASKFEFPLAGTTGTVDYSDYFRRLAASGYRGCVMVEVSGLVSSKPGYDPAAAAKTVYAALAPAFEKAGVRRR